MMDPSATPERVIFLQLDPINSDYMTECIFLIAESLNYIWERRRENRQIDLEQMKAKIRSKCFILSKSRNYGMHGTNLIALIETGGT